MTSLRGHHLTHRIGRRRQPLRLRMFEALLKPKPVERVRVPSEKTARPRIAAAGPPPRPIGFKLRREP